MSVIRPAEATSKKHLQSRRDPQGLPHLDPFSNRHDPKRGYCYAPGTLLQSSSNPSSRYQHATSKFRERNGCMQMESEPENYSSLKIDEADQIDELVGRYDELLLEIEDLGKEIEVILGQVTAIQKANPEVLVDLSAPASHN